MSHKEIDDTDRLLGDLAEDLFGHDIRSHTSDTSSLRGKLRILTILLLYAYNVSIIILLLGNLNDPLLVPKLLVYVTLSIILTSSKHYYLFTGYSLELYDPEINYRYFSLIQTILNTFFLSASLLVVAMLVGLISEFSLSLISILTFVIIAGVCYTYFSDFPLIAQGFGMSMYSFSTGLIAPYRNLMQASDVSSHAGRRIAVIRFIYIVTQITFVFFNVGLAYIVILPIPYTIYMYYSEIKQSSKLLMVIRGRLSELVPGSIPEYEPSSAPIGLRNPVDMHRKVVFRNSQFIRNEPMKIANIHQPASPKEVYTPSNDESSNFAAKTLYRIIDKVRNEGPLQPRGRIYYCINCGISLTGNHGYCTKCGGNSQ